MTLCISGVTSSSWWSGSADTPGTWRPGPPSAAPCSPGRPSSRGWAHASSSTRSTVSSASFIIISKLKMNKKWFFRLFLNYCNYAFYYSLICSNIKWANSNYQVKHSSSSPYLRHSKWHRKSNYEHEQSNFPEQRPPVSRSGWRSPWAPSLTSSKTPPGSMMTPSSLVWSSLCPGEPIVCVYWHLVTCAGPRGDHPANALTVDSRVLSPGTSNLISMKKRRVDRWVSCNKWRDYAYIFGVRSGFDENGSDASYISRHQMCTSRKDENDLLQRFILLLRKFIFIKYLNL